MTLIQSLFTKYQGFIHLRNKDLIVLHGNQTDIINSHIRNTVVFDHKILWKAKKHIFSFKNDQELFSYLTDHTVDLNKESQLYLVSQNVDRNNFTQNRIHVCNLPEICARSYWQNYPLDINNQVIVIIGNGHYARKLIDYAILLNIYSPTSEIHYHWFCSDDTYLLQHTQLHQCIAINESKSNWDSLFIHHESWENCRDLVENASRVILADDNDSENINTLNLLKAYYGAKRIDIRHLNINIISSLWGDDVHVFGMENELYNEDYLLNDKAFETSKKIHATYLKNYVCKKNCNQDCLNCQTLLDDWNKLNPFTRYSNVTQADHITIKKHILNHRKTDLTQSLKDVYQQLSEKELLILDEIEHIRWARYHYFNNWTYGESRDKINKKHPLLVPFNQLDYEEILKDRDTWQTALDILEKEKKL